MKRWVLVGLFTACYELMMASIAVGSHRIAELVYLDRLYGAMLFVLSIGPALFMSHRLSNSLEVAPKLTSRDFADFAAPYARAMCV